MVLLSIDIQTRFLVLSNIIVTKVYLWLYNNSLIFCGKGNFSDYSSREELLFENSTNVLGDVWIENGLNPFIPVLPKILS